MKKKELSVKLTLGKHVISKLNSNEIQGGTIPITIPITITIETIKRSINTVPDACTIIATCYCSETCPAKCGC